MARTNRTPAERYRACSRPARERVRAMALHLLRAADDDWPDFPELPNALGLRSNLAECSLASKLATIATRKGARWNMPAPDALGWMLGVATLAGPSEAIH